MIYYLFRVGYGAYGQIRECKFGIEELSLLDRGFIFAIAHVRGGTEMVSNISSITILSMLTSGFRARNGTRKASC